ncbi:MAG: deoxyribodipyrimidine photo-lyase [Acidobacteria bacterium]|nr:deoxyribodipyrimidine photo-lyase [Acidobacteriota bacterium]
MDFFWFRRDLRLVDNRGLDLAMARSSALQPIFIFDPTILSQLEDKADLRVQGIFLLLQRLDEQLAQLGSGLRLFFAEPLEAWRQIAAETQIGTVYGNEDYEPYPMRRDHTVQEFLQSIGAQMVWCKDQVIRAKAEVLKPDGKPYTVFTPYKRKWLETLERQDITPSQSQPQKANWVDRSEKCGVLDPEWIGFSRSGFELPKIETSHLGRYGEVRDYPALNATSQLGFHLRFGSVSVRQWAQRAQSTNETWYSQFIWRDFFMQILWHFPHVVHGPFRPEYGAIQWENNPEAFERWKQGQTGYPLVDAGMRELAQKGTMPNRVRMVVASFLSKHLLIDWRWGERYFAQKLLDYDLAANNGNWQWAAGTGCDAAPYFRVFNPETQLQKFDPQACYVKAWVPEFGTPDYPKPMIDHQWARQRALASYQRAVKK